MRRILGKFVRFFRAAADMSNIRPGLSSHVGSSFQARQDRFLCSLVEQESSSSPDDYLIPDLISIRDRSSHLSINTTGKPIGQSVVLQPAVRATSLNLSVVISACLGRTLSEQARLEVTLVGLYLLFASSLPSRDSIFSCLSEFARGVTSSWKPTLELPTTIK